MTSMSAPCAMRKATCVGVVGGRARERERARVLVDAEQHHGGLERRERDAALAHLVHEDRRRRAHLLAAVLSAPDVARHAGMVIVDDHLDLRVERHGGEFAEAPGVARVDHDEALDASQVEALQVHERQELGVQGCGTRGRCAFCVPRKTPFAPGKSFVAATVEAYASKSGFAWPTAIVEPPVLVRAHRHCSRMSVVRFDGLVAHHDRVAEALLAGVEQPFDRRRAASRAGPPAPRGRPPSRASTSPAAGSIVVARLLAARPHRHRRAPDRLGVEVRHPARARARAPRARAANAAAATGRRPRARPRPAPRPTRRIFAAARAALDGARRAGRARRPGLARRLPSTSIRDPSARHSWNTSSGPAPRTTAIASATSSALPTAQPSGWSMSLRSATTRFPSASPVLTSSAASAARLLDRLHERAAAHLDVQHDGVRAARHLLRDDAERR